MFRKELLLPYFLCLAAIIFLIAYISAAEKHPAYYTQLKVNKGDSIEWKNLGYNDGHWENKIPLQSKANWWLRLPVNTASYKTSGNTGIFVSVHGSYQLFWDGILIGQNGKWGKTKAEEVEGKRLNYFFIPDSLLVDTTHLLAVRISSFYDLNRQIYPRFIVGNYFSLVTGGLKFAIFMHMLAGTFLVMGLYCFFLYFISFRYLPYLLFGVLCSVFLTMLLLEYLNYYYLYPYSFHFKRLFLVASMSFLSGNVLLLFLLVFLNIRHKTLFVAGLNILLVIAWITRESYDDKIKTISISAFTLALFVSLIGVQKKHVGGKEVFYGIVACLTAHVNYEMMVYIGFGVLIVCMLLSLSKQIREQRRSQQEAVLVSKRLEIELLKKNIQPHFLMNSLTSLMEWVERSPRQSIDFIHALASEFSLLNKASAEKQIPLALELNLCKSHLQVMSFRKDVKYSLNVNEIDESETIPPALLLTILENGITHNIPVNNEMVFVINFCRQGKTKTYFVLSRGQRINNGSAVKKSTGMKYIEARLEESYPGKWTYNSWADVDGWCSEIIIVD